MARFTILIGIVLFLLAIFAFMGTGAKYPTSLIPAAFGIVLGVCGALARTPDVKRRAVWMHIAVSVGLIGYLATVKSVVDFFRMESGVQFKLPIAVEEKAAMSVLLLIFVIACVRSFIAARRARVAGA